MNVKVNTFIIKYVNENLLQFLSLPRQYQEEVDLGFPGSLVCALLLLLLLGGIQAVALPRTTILLLLFLTAFIWIAVILMLLLAVRYKIIIYELRYY